MKQARNVDGRRKIYMNMRKVLILVAVAVITGGCFQGNRSEAGPEEALEIYYRHLCKGDFAGAASLCDTLSMAEHIAAFRSAWEEADSSVAAVASDILSEMSLNVTDEIKNGQKRTLLYELTATDGQSKEKVATLRKEEGAWKIEAITDRH